MRVVSKWLILVLILMVVGFVVMVIYLQNTCSATYDSIDEELKQANHCAVDSDCKVLELGGIYVKFGCYHYIHKDVSREDLYAKMDAYWNKCTRIINDCARAPNPICVNQKCVEAS